MMERLKDGSQVTGIVMRFRRGPPSREDEPDLEHQRGAGEEDQSVESWGVEGWGVEGRGVEGWDQGA